MNSIKCKSCGLTNFSTESACRRCGNSLLQTVKVKKEKSRSPVSVWTLLLLALFGAVAYYAYHGTLESMDKVNAEEANRAASHPAERPLTPGLSRTEYDKQKSQTYGDAVKNSGSLADHNKHIQQTERIMQEVSNNQVER